MLVLEKTLQTEFANTLGSMVKNNALPPLDNKDLHKSFSIFFILFPNRSAYELFKIVNRLQNSTP